MTIRRILSAIVVAVANLFPGCTDSGNQEVGSTPTVSHQDR